MRSTNVNVQYDFQSKQHIKFKGKQHVVSDRVRADVLGGHVAASWVSLHNKPAPTSHLLHRSQPQQWCHIREGIKIPMPSDKVLTGMTREFFQRCEGQPVGPVTAAWRSRVFEWARSLREKLFGPGAKVTGLWSKAAKRFKKRLRYMPKAELAHIMREITRGFSHPFMERPRHRLLAARNHPNLADKPHAVYRALLLQLQEGSLLPWDWRKRGWPKGVYSLRWVEKQGSTEVRLTLNGRPFNIYFGKDEVSITLETHAELRGRYIPGMMFLGFDLHHGFYNASYDEAAREWVCFRIHESELDPEHVRQLRSRYKSAWKDGYVYFSYKGLVMGLSPSCKQLTKVIDALMHHWRRCPVKGIAWDMTNYIDDSMAMVQGSFRGGLQLSLRLLAEYICLGFSVNLNSKSTIIPTTFYCHIGVLISSARMRFSLPQRRVTKTEAALVDLFTHVTVGKRVCAKKVAKVVGLLWAASIVCQRAVAIMTRGLIRTLAVMLRTSAARGVDDPKRLAYILKRVWGGTVLWTTEANDDLVFWMQVQFEKLSSPISHDAWSRDISTWVLEPSSGTVASDVRVFAVDTSAYASGGGEFLRDGLLWRVKNKMVVQLTDEEVLESSTLRELIGTERLDLSVIPDTCTKAVLAMDAMASVQCLLNGSKVAALQKVVRKIFLRQLRHNRVLFPTWVRRSKQLLRMCDKFSRINDFHRYAMPSATFWRANAVAIKIWGQGFQMDVCADMHNVQPGDLTTKLPFFSRWCSPHSSGVDMFSQDWSSTTNWCNPPFAVIPRVLSLLRAQQATAAVVMPLGVGKWWSYIADERLPVVQAVVPLVKSAVWQPKRAPRGDRKERRKSANKLAIVFLDFGCNPPTQCFRYLGPPAETLPRHPAPSTTFLQIPRDMHVY